jgi:hypothetical protein
MRDADDVKTATHSSEPYAIAKPASGAREAGPSARRQRGGRVLSEYALSDGQGSHFAGSAKWEGVD